MVRMEMIGVDENDNKPDLEDASHYNMDDFNDAISLIFILKEDINQKTFLSCLNLLFFRTLF